MKQNISQQYLATFLSTLNLSSQPVFLYVGYSGGVDSTVLLHLASQLQLSDSSVQIKGIYVNHQLSPNADHWQQFCQQTCETLAVGFIAKTVVIDSNADGLEAEARKARYRAFNEVLSCHKPTDQVLLLLGQHSDDQAETFLLQLKRGAGAKGLSAMAAVSPLEQPNHFMLRPLLCFNREQIEHYALQHQLEWMEDESNQDSRFDRNFIRHQIMPKLTERWPGFVKAVNRTTQHLAEQQQLLDELATMDLIALAPDENSIDIAKLVALSPVRGRNVLRYWLASMAVEMPSTVLLNRVFSEVLLAGTDKQPEVNWQSYQLRRFKGRLYLLKQGDTDEGQDCLWHDISQPLLIKTLNNQVITQLSPLDFAFRQVMVKFAKKGEYNHIRVVKKGNDFGHKLSDIFKQYQVPPWQRSRIPLIYSGDQLVMIVIRDQVLTNLNSMR